MAQFELEPQLSPRQPLNHRNNLLSAYTMVSWTHISPWFPHHCWFVGLTVFALHKLFLLGETLPFLLCSQCGSPAPFKVIPEVTIVMFKNYVLSEGSFWSCVGRHFTWLISSYDSCSPARGGWHMYIKGNCSFWIMCFEDVRTHFWQISSMNT